MSAFANLKNNRGNALAALSKKVQAVANGEGGGGNRDERFWRHTYDKTTKKGSAVIRFLPFGMDADRLPWSEYIEFSFKGRGGNYWNRSLKTLDKDDPVAELNHLQWERNQGNDQDEVKKRGRSFRYIANIVVVDDPARPENNGKQFLYKYGKSIHDKIMGAWYPEYADKQGIPVFDLWDGANFRIRTKDKSGFLNYDDSEFDLPAPLHRDDTLLEKWYNGMHDLNEIDDAKNYKSWDDLNKEMRKVLGEAYCASILGEEFNPANAAASGGSPFPQQGGPAQQQGGQQKQGGGDPFASQNQQQGGDPFASSGQNQQQGGDPFASSGGQPAQQQGNVDPFAGASGGGDNNDPFADIDLDG